MFAAIPALAARAGQPAERFDRHRPGRRDHPALCQQPRRRRAWPSWAPPAPTTSCAPRSSRCMSTGTRRPKIWTRSSASSAPGWSSTAQDYAAYYQQHKHPDSPAMRDPNPTVILIPGLGMIAWGKDKSEVARDGRVLQLRGRGHARRGGDRRVHRACRCRKRSTSSTGCWKRPSCSACRRRRSWPARSSRWSARAAASAARCALRLAKEGAHVVCVDRDAPRPRRRRPRRSTDKYGVGIGVAGSGISGCGPAIGLPADITERASIRAMLDQAGAGLWRARRASRSPPASSSRRTPPAASPTSMWALHVRDQRDRAVPGGRRGGDDLAGAGAAGQPGADHHRPTRWWPRRAAWPTTPARRRPTTWCASWRSSWRRWCA